MYAQTREENYNQTIVACFVGYIVQAIINNFVPLLFLTFQKNYQISLPQITMLVTFNFGVQLVVDLLAIGFVDKIGYRTSIVTAHIFSACGLLLITLLPDALSSPFLGILFSVMLYAIGGGLLEVLVSPIVESCPSNNKEKAMSMLHSFYCWGHVGVVLFSTLFFHLFGIENWKVLARLWALIPIFNSFIFLKVPMVPLIKQGEKSLHLAELLKSKVFWIFVVMMICSGASEQSVSQWVSAFAEKGLGISKTAGDLAGPMLFAICMGIARAFYGKYGECIRLDIFMKCSAGLCVLSYISIALLGSPFLNLMACAVCGFSVGIMWPGTFSKAASLIPKGGTAMFALLALGGDLGCSMGPTMVGFVSDAMQENLKYGLSCAAIFPIGLLLGLWSLKSIKAFTLSSENE